MKKIKNNGENGNAVFLYPRKMLIAIFTLAGLLCIILAFSFTISMIKSNNSHLHFGDPTAAIPLTEKEQVDGGDKLLGTVIEASAAVGDDYFSDALFIGDSLTEGISLYDVFAGYNAISKRGLNPTTILTEKFYKDGDKELTMLEAVMKINPRKLYIMLGTNGMNWSYVNVDELIKGYDEFVTALVENLPGCQIIIQAIPPTTVETATSITGYKKENVDYYNEGLKNIAMKKGLYFLDVNAGIAGPDGYLPEEIASPDGIHFQASGYAVWKNYLMTHTVQGNSSFSMGDDGLIQILKVSSVDGPNAGAAEAPPPAEAAPQNSNSESAT
ncbi:MAG: GDSL-type esterase/lipase family protein [Oscillospiraceae bacterium]